MKIGWDEQIYKYIAPRRSILFRPVVIVLSKLRIHPDLISYLGLSFMVGFAYCLPEKRMLAFWLLISMLVCDQLDGALARYNKTASDRGKFVDVLVDTTSFALFTIGLNRAGIMSSILSLTIIYLVSLGKILSTIKKNIGPIS